jgi:hypothetical protein
MVIQKLVKSFLLSYRAWAIKNRSRNKQLKKFVKENQALVLPSRHRLKRGRDAQHAQQEEQLPPVSANIRPRNQARKKEASEEEQTLEVRIVLAAAPAAVAPPPAPATGAAEAAEDSIMTLGEKCEYAIRNRNNAWARLDKQGKIPDFLKEWMTYCKSLTAYECPDYDKLRAILENAPEVAHIAQAYHAQRKAMQNED